MTKVNPRNAPFFSVARFGPGSIIVFVLLIFLTAFLYVSGHEYIAILPAVAGVAIFVVKATEMLEEQKPKARTTIGQSCLVIKEISKRERGIVRIYRENGDLDPELWSAEGENGVEIMQNQRALVVERRSIILIVRPESST